MARRKIERIKNKTKQNNNKVRKIGNLSGGDRLYICSKFYYTFGKVNISVIPNMPFFLYLNIDLNGNMYVKIFIPMLVSLLVSYFHLLPLGFLSSLEEHCRVSVLHIKTGKKKKNENG